MKPPPSLSCPSGQPEMPGAVVFGVVTGNESQPDVAWLEAVIPATPELLAKTGNIEPQRVFRIAVTCQESRCVHFDGTQCKLAHRIVEFLPVAASSLPRCAIRATCRWFFQEGRAACLRCPQVVTHTYNPPENVIKAAQPA